MINKTNKPSIAILFNSFWVYKQGASGGDEMAVQVFGRIRKEFNKIYWYTNLDGSLFARKTVKEVEFSSTPAWMDKMPIFISCCLRTLSGFINLKKINVDILYSSSDFFPDVIPAWLYCRLKPKTKWVQCIFHIYPDWKTRPGNKFISWAVSNLQKVSIKLSKKSDIIICINQEVRKYLIDQEFDKNRIFVIPPGVDLEYIDNINPFVNNKYGCYDAIFLGRLCYSKGIMDIPKIWKLVSNEVPNARLGIIGGASESVSNYLSSEFDSLGIFDQVDLCGFVDTDQKYNLLKNSRVLLFPSHEEGFGIAIVEALGCELPVVAWNLTVYEELFEDSLTLIEENDIKTFANKVIYYINNTVSLGKIRSNRLIAEKYSWLSSSNKMKQLLCNL